MTAARLIAMTITRRGARRSGLVHTITIALAAILLVGGCSGRGDDDSASPGAGDLAEGEAAGDAPNASRVAPQDGVSADEAGSNRVSDPDLVIGPTYEIKQGRIELESTDVAAVVDKLYTLAARVGGDIASERTSTDAKGQQTHSSVLLMVPVDTFDDAMREIPGFGTLRGRELSSEDVSTQVADVDVRVANARESLAQLRALFRRATKLGDIIVLESEISTRQTELESLLAQQRTLAEQTAMSEITVTVTRPSEPAPKSQQSDDDQAGFLAGLGKGWDALVAFVLTLGHAAGAALPITLLLIVVALAARPFVRRVRPTWWRPTPSE